MHSRAATAALIFGLIAGAATHARAQCAFDQSFPNANDVLADPQPAVTIDFTEEFDLQEVRLLAADNTEWPTDWGRSTQEVRKAEFRVTKPLPPGPYMIIWNGYLRRHYHADGGSISFTVASAGETPTTAIPAAAPSTGAAPRVGRGSPYPMFLGAGARNSDR
jgi:methionine-rich copper-binding protein CopC